MSGEKYIGLDVHQATICAAVMDPMGKVIIESILVPGLLPAIAGQRHQADYGASHASAKDCSDYVDSVEEGRKLRRRKTKIASRLSVSGEEPSHLR